MKILVRTFGCQMNVRDSEIVAGSLLEHGFEIARSAEEADIFLFNSCAVRKHAEDRLISNVASLTKLKRKKPHIIIGLMGCSAQYHKDALLKKLPMLDFVCGPGNECDIPTIIEDIIANRCAIVATDKMGKKKPEACFKYREHEFKAFVSTGEGCNNFCSYCIVPYVRGGEESRDIKDIVKEVSDLAARGFKEITLLGQNVNSFKGSRVKGQGSSFVKLLEKLNEIKDIERIRFMTSHPKDASIDLFRAMRDLDKACEHLHLPLQSGSDRILKLMNRRYTAKKYIKLAEEYKKYVPEGSITTDIIVGFPSESQKDFHDTVDLMQKVGFDSAFVFKYSPRPPARASKLIDNVPEDEKNRRLQTVLDLQCVISRKRNEPWQGKVVEVLVDGAHDKSAGFLVGRTRTNKTAIFRGDKKLVGKLVPVTIESVKPHTLLGKIAS